MPASVSIWLEVAHHGAFRIGGWAFVRVAAGEVRGTAGGARRIDLETAGLMALTAALADLPAGADTALRSSSGAVLDATRRIAQALEHGNPPTETLDLWAEAATAIGRVRLVTHKADLVPGGPSAFAAAWAELARDRAKDKGPFSAVIPKSNLAKAGV